MSGNDFHLFHHRNQLGFPPTMQVRQVFRNLDTNDDNQVTLVEWMSRGGDLRSFATLLVRYDENCKYDTTMQLFSY